MLLDRRSEVPPRERPVSPPRRSRRPRPSPLDELEPSKPDGIWEQDGLTTRRWIARSLLLLAKRDASVGDVRYLDMGDLFYLSHDDYSHLSSFPPRGFGGTIRLSSQSKLLGFAVVLTRYHQDGGEFRVGPSTIGMVKEKIGLNAKRVTARLDNSRADAATYKRRG
jgi:hypothetical protein